MASTYNPFGTMNFGANIMPKNTYGDWSKGTGVGWKIPNLAPSFGGLKLPNMGPMLNPSFKAPNAMSKGPSYDDEATRIFDSHNKFYQDRLNSLLQNAINPFYQKEREASDAKLHEELKALGMEGTTYAARRHENAARTLDAAHNSMQQRMQDLYSQGMSKNPFGQSMLNTKLGDDATRSKYEGGSLADRTKIMNNFNTSLQGQRGTAANDFMNQNQRAIEGIKSSFKNKASSVFEKPNAYQSETPSTGYLS